VQLQCNNTGTAFNGTAYDTANGDYSAGSKSSFLEAYPVRDDNDFAQVDVVFFSQKP
jgi:hypothetical protein